MNTRLDTLAYTNRLRHLPPWQKVGFALTVLMVVLISHAPVQAAVFCWMTVWIVNYAGIPVQTYRTLIGGTGLFLIMSLPVLLINFSVADISPGVDAILKFKILNWQVYLSHRAIVQAAEVFCRTIASTACLFFIVLTTPVFEIASGLTRLGCPSILIELLLLTYRFIFLLAEGLERMVLAQTARGGYRTRKLMMTSTALLIRQLLQRTIERYHQLSLGIRARGFSYEFRFWHPHPYQYSHRYGLEAIIGCTGLLGWEAWSRLHG